MQKASEENSVHGIVLHLLQDFSGFGHTFYLDKFFTSVSCPDALEKINTILVGTIVKTTKDIFLCK